MSRYSSQSVKSTRPSQAIEDSKKKTSLLRDGSWIRKSDEEEEDIDRDPNFGRSVLSRYRSSETLVSKETEEKKPTRTTSTSSVHALAQRFGGSQDNLSKSSTLPTSNPTSSYTRRSYSSVKSPLQDSTKITTKTETVVKEEPKKSSTTTTVTKDGKTTETTITTTQSVRSPVIKSPSKTETFSERVRSSSKGSLYSSYSPARTTKVTEPTVTTDKGAEDKLYDTLIPSPIKDDYSPKDSAEDKLYDTLIPKTIKNDVPDGKTTVSTTKTVKSSPDGDSIKTTTTTRTFSYAEDKLYDTLIPKTAKNEVPSSPEDKLYDTLIPKTIKDEAPDSKTTVFSTKTVDSSPNGDGIKTTTTTRTSSTAEDDLYNTLLPKGITSNPSSPVSTNVTKREIVTVESSRSRQSPTLRSPSSTHRRSLHEKDLCTSCHKPFNGEAKMVLDEMKINCHASCFKCEVCNSTLGHMKAGDSMWIYRQAVHCERCFEITRDKWRR